MGTAHWCEGGLAEDVQLTPHQVHTHWVLPTHQQASVLPLRGGDRNSAALITSDRLRHLRLGYLIQKRFPGLLKAWWLAPFPRQVALDHTMKRGANALSRSHGGWAAISRLGRGEYKDAVAIVRRRIGKGLVRQVARAARSSRTALLAGDEIRRVEQQMFRREVDTLRIGASLEPTAVSCADSDTPGLMATLRQLDPYFLLEYGGAPVPLGIVSSVRGLALRQHDGWTSTSATTSTAEEALYHRKLGWVGSTVHVMDPAGPGPILRRSTATLHPGDSVAHCVLAVSALGHKLLLEVIGRALVDEHLHVFPRVGAWRTPLDADLGPVEREALARDFEAGWLGDAIEGVRNF
jgi:hypothetical protein